MYHGDHGLVPCGEEMENVMEAAYLANLDFVLSQEEALVDDVEESEQQKQDEPQPSSTDDNKKPTRQNSFGNSSASTAFQIKEMRLPQPFSSFSVSFIGGWHDCCWCDDGSLTSQLTKTIVNVLSRTHSVKFAGVKFVRGGARFRKSCLKFTSTVELLNGNQERYCDHVASTHVGESLALPEDKHDYQNLVMVIHG